MAFSPKVYDFVLSKEFSDSILYWGLNNYKVQRPKYSVLLDHTLGVIWHIFNQNGAELITLNKSQLIWALRFLEAIDVSKVPDNTDLQSLIRYLRKIIITRYSLEDEDKFFEANQTMVDSIGGDDPSSSALGDYLNNPCVRKERRKAKTVQSVSQFPLSCDEDEMLKRLKLINPNIESLDQIRDIRLVPQATSTPNGSDEEII